MRYAIDSSKLQRKLGWEPSLQFEKGIEKTVRWYLDNEAWMDNVTSDEYEKYYENMYIAFLLHNILVVHPQHNRQ